MNKTLFSALVIFALVNTVYCEVSPMLMWSKDQSLFGKNQQDNTYHDAAAFSSKITNLLNNPDAKVVVIGMDGLTTNKFNKMIKNSDTALAKLQAEIESSNSLSIPYSELTTESLLVKVLEQAFPERFSSLDLNTESAQDLKEILAQSGAQLVFVKANEETLESALNVLASEQNVVTVMRGFTDPKTLSQMNFRQQESKKTSQARLLADSDNYITSTGISALFIAGFLLFITVCGFQQLGNLQTPPNFDVKSNLPTIRRES